MKCPGWMFEKCMDNNETKIVNNNLLPRVNK